MALLPVVSFTRPPSLITDSRCMAYPVLLIWADIKIVFFFLQQKRKPLSVPKLFMDNLCLILLWDFQLICSYIAFFIYVCILYNPAQFFIKQYVFCGARCIDKGKHSWTNAGYQKSTFGGRCMSDSYFCMIFLFVLFPPLHNLRWNLFCR